MAAKAERIPVFFICREKKKPVFQKRSAGFQYVLTAESGQICIDGTEMHGISNQFAYMRRMQKQNCGSAAQTNDRKPQVISGVRLIGHQFYF